MGDLWCFVDDNVHFELALVSVCLFWGYCALFWYSLVVVQIFDVWPFLCRSLNG